MPAEPAGATDTAVATGETVDNSALDRIDANIIPLYRNDLKTAPFNPGPHFSGRFADRAMISSMRR